MPVAALTIAKPVSRESLLIAAATLLTTLGCWPLWRTVLELPEYTPGLLASLGVAVLGINLLLLALLTPGKAFKPLLIVLLIGSAVATHFMLRYRVFLNPDMLRNALQTDQREAGELLNGQLLADVLLMGALPALLVWRLQIRPRGWLAGSGRRIALVLLALLMIGGGITAHSRDISALMRNHKSLRYLINPANYLYSFGRLMVDEGVQPSGPLAVLGADVVRGPQWQQRKRPSLLIVVLGETARAANWGLAGYERQTTPRLAQMPDLLSWTATACGTDTASSVPCLFSPGGRHDYDPDLNRRSESLLHVIERAGIKVQWRDNQGGCKGVCTGLETWSFHEPERARQAGCPSDGCLDDALLVGLRDKIGALDHDQVLVLHQLGNHGPAYWKRVPAQFRRFVPVCESGDLGNCSRQEIVNAYDNAILFTDDLLARLIGLLREQGDRLDSGLLYLSDHGESLGEKGLYLHGMPYQIAPREQTQVPMLAWLSPALQQANRLDDHCLSRMRGAQANHDHLFHTVLGLLDLQTAVRDPAWDLFAPCRKPPKD